MSTNERRAKQHKRRDDYIFFIKYNTRWSDNDQYAHVNNAIYYHIIDSVVNTYLEKQCGLKPSIARSANAAVFTELPPIGLVVSSHCSFFSPLSFPQVLDVGLRVVSLGRTSVEYEVGIFVEGEDEASAIGGYIHVFVDRMTRKPVAGGISGELRRGLEGIQERKVSPVRSGGVAKL